MNDLLENIDRIRTTPLGAERISRNLNLRDEPVAWVVEQIKTSSDITRKGKNWHIKTDKAIITINASSYTIITAHQNKES